MAPQPTIASGASMKVALSSLTAAVLAFASVHASAADSYTASIQGCQKSINERLGVTDASYSVKKIQTSPRYRDINFSVSAEEATNPIHQLKVSCRAKSDGEVLAVQFDETALPSAVATH
jgi:hypothetical protein